MSTNNTNLIIMSGNLTTDCEYKATPTGHHLINFAIANNRTVGQQENVNFIGVVKFGTANIQNLANYLKKGTGVIVTGELRQEKWKDNSGQNRSTYRIYASDIEFKGGGQKQGDTGGYQQQPQQPPQQQPVQYGGYNPPTQRQTYQPPQQQQQQQQPIVRPNYQDPAVDNALNQAANDMPDWANGNY